MALLRFFRTGTRYKDKNNIESLSVQPGSPMRYTYTGKSKVKDQETGAAIYPVSLRQLGLGFILKGPTPI